MDFSEKPDMVHDDDGEIIDQDEFDNESNYEKSEENENSDEEQ